MAQALTVRARLTTGQDLTSRAKQSQGRQSSWDQENGGRSKEQRAKVCCPRVSCYIKVCALLVPGSMQADPGEGGFTVGIDLENLK